MEPRGLSKVKSIISLPILTLSINLLFACSVASKDVRDCNEGVIDNRFSGYIFEGPYTVNQATEIFNKETRDYPSHNLTSNWESFLNEADTSSCIYRFTSSDGDWNKLQGANGFALTQDAKVINIFIVKKS